MPIRLHFCNASFLLLHPVGKNEATTEELRAAMIHYRSLFEELVQVPTIVETKAVA